MRSFRKKAKTVRENVNQSMVIVTLILWDINNKKCSTLLVRLIKVSII